MKKILVLLAVFLTVVDAGAAPRQAVASRGGSSSGGASKAVPSVGATKSSGGSTGGVQQRRAARSATTSPSTAPVVSGGTSTTAEEAAAAAKGQVRGRKPVSSDEDVDTGKKTQARAAKQNVVTGGTKVAAATQNTLVDDACRQKFDGCMDSFCMMENTSGGRCLCSDKNKELNKILAEIEKLDAQSYKMATEGVEQIEMGEDVEAVMAKTKAITKNLNKEPGEEDDGKSRRRTLNLDAWKTSEEDEEESVFGSDENRIENQKGDALFAMSYDLCVEQMPECSSSFNMLSSLYRQRVRSDCAAFENSLKKQQTESAQKLATAEAAMREAALEQYKSANKYDLSQCVIQFKDCMKTTAGCGDDFTGCAGVAAAEEAVTKKNAKKKSKQTTIKGAVSSITIAAATYDTLMAKKPLCMDVTKNCVNVRDQVWDTFLAEVAPELKSAELAAESNLRTSCIGNIAQCFQKACRDNIDPNDEEGSYDMCLSRPETLESVCKVEIAPCKAAEPKIMDYVRAKLASMRVDACTNEFKGCLQDGDRCGSDYTQCIGLDTDTIVRLCPQEKLTACYQEYGGQKSTVDNALATLVTGILLNIDNSMLNACQTAAQTKFLEICGNLNDCRNIAAENKIIGTESLAAMRSGKTTTISGLVNFGKIGMKEMDVSEEYPDVKYYNIDLGRYQMCEGQGENVLRGIENTVKRKFELLLTDPTVSMCISGRDLRQITGGKGRKKKSDARFPHLLDSYAAVIVDSAIRVAQSNYNNRYTELLVEAEKTSKSDSEDYKNQIACNRMALTDDYDEVTMKADPNNTGVEINECNVIIKSAAGREEMLEAMKQKNHTKRVLTAKTSSALKEVNRKIDKKRAIEDSENMVGMVDITAVYEPGAKVCRITTQTYSCKGMTTISDSKSTSVEAGAEYAGVGGNVGVSTSATTYKGSVCSSFTEPIISEQLITMGNGVASVKDSNISRSNLQSEYINNSTNIDNSVNDDSFSLSTGDIAVANRGGGSSGGGSGFSAGDLVSLAGAMGAFGEGGVANGMSDLASKFLSGGGDEEDDEDNELELLREKNKAKRLENQENRANDKKAKQEKRDQDKLNKEAEKKQKQADKAKDKEKKDQNKKKKNNKGDDDSKKKSIF